jgi:putative restriction endonuclease
MVKGVFIHNLRSKYDDQPERHYHFPKQYLGRAKAFIGDWILYYESGKSKGRKSYTALAKILEIVPDYEVSGMYYAFIEPGTYLNFDHPVPFRLDGNIANSFLKNSDGSVNSGRNIWAIRPISDVDFARIVELGFTDKMLDLPRDDIYEVTETDQSPFIFDQEREKVEIRLTRVKRDRVFRTHVLDAYDKRCSLTGLSFINGGGRAEVQAAHIRPVSENGPDSINNGLALSGTIHWMFDRGLLSISNDHDILISRHVNNIEEVERLINKNKKAIMPKSREYWPHPSYLSWHREFCFKT